MNKSIGAVVLSAALAATAAGAFAQDRHGQRPFTKPTERIEARLAYVKTALKITDAQQAQWNAYADAQRKLAAEREQKFAEWRQKMAEHRKERAEGKAPQERPRASAVERLDRAGKMHAEAIKRLNAQLAVVKPLYDSLSAEQKKVADVVLVPEHRRGFHRGHGHGRGMA